MSIGDQWAQFGGGAMDKESSFRLLDAYYEAGGNFIDTANSYQDGSSEAFIGEWMEARGVRDQMVVATKVGMISGIIECFGADAADVWLLNLTVLCKHDAWCEGCRAEGALRRQ